jgi:hypothetical protein
VLLPLAVTDTEQTGARFLVLDTVLGEWGLLGGSTLQQFGFSVLLQQREFQFTLHRLKSLKCLSAQVHKCT